MTRLTDQLWQRYRAYGDEATRNLLLDQYLGLVHHAARDLAKRLPATLELEDLVSAGTIGLVQALESFDPARGLAFSSFAVPRIRGAILDESRSLSWIPRTARERNRRIDAARARLEQRLGREPAGEEIAEEMEIPVATYREWADDGAAPVFLNLESPGEEGRRRGPRMAETIADASAAEPGQEIERAEERRELAAALDALSERERTILALHYHEGLTFRQIGTVLRLTESRICQIHTRTIQRLRARIAEMERVKEEAA
ncbi:MAG: sigma-70 family RNA polymerase sigma factor [Candidatus Eisenbacteria bacterium]